VSEFVGHGLESFRDCYYSTGVGQFVIFSNLFTVIFFYLQQDLQHKSGSVARLSESAVV
jgi:hypothetical protein